MNVEWSEDRFLNGRLILKQPKHGYRAAIDPVFLAAAIQAKPHERILDAGCGVGVSSFCLLSRLSDIKVIGIEIQSSLANLAHENAIRNDMAARFSVIEADLRADHPILRPESFDHILTNPPYVAQGRGTSSPNPVKQIADMESDLSLEQWLKRCLSLLRHKGVLTLIHRADRLGEILSYLEGKAGEILIHPLWPKHGMAARRVIIRARKNLRSPLVMMPGLVLHDADGAYSFDAERILRHGQGLDILAYDDKGSN